MFQLSCGLTCGNSCVPLWAMQHLGFPNKQLNYLDPTVLWDVFPICILYF